MTILILIIFLLILLLIIIFFCFKFCPPLENFQNLPHQKIEQLVQKEINQFQKFSKEDLLTFYETHPKIAILVELHNNTFKIKYSENLKDKSYIQKINHMFRDLQTNFKNLPNCTLVFSIEDQTIQTPLPIFQNSVFHDEKGLLSPLWYWFSEEKLKGVLNGITTPWLLKKNQAVWRGSSTGYSGQNYRSGRKVSRKYIVDTSIQFPGLLDAGFTNLVQKGGETLKDQSYRTKNVIDPIDQTKYKYIITTDGNGGTYGLYWTLASGSCPLNNSQYRQWFSPFFKENEHYVTFSDEEDHTNLHEVIRRLQKNDQKAKKIAKEAQNVSKKIFTKPFVLLYTYTLINEFCKKQNTTF